METAVIYGFLIALSMGLGALAIFIWAVLSGQMEDTEEIKYRILEQELSDE
jgi:cbb3-type cytochrome oxidase maturation protein